MRIPAKYGLFFTTAGLASLCAFLALQNRALRGELAKKERPRITASPKRPGFIPSAESGMPRRSARMPQDDPPPGAAIARGRPGGSMEEAVAERIKTMRKEQAEKRKRRLEELKNMTAEEKASRREAFIERMRGRSERRLAEFVRKTGLNAAETESFSSTVAALDDALQERAREWAAEIAATGTFTQDARIKFISDMTEVLGAGYAEMDASLPASWRADDGDLNLMQIVGDAAFAPVVEALTEAGLDDGLQTIGMLMGGPGGAPSGDGGAQAGDGGGIPAGGEAPGQMGGPGMGGPGM